MASMLRLLVSRQSRQPILKTAQTLLASDGIFVRTLLGHSFPYIENYTNKRDEIREKFSKNLDDIRKNLTSSQIVNYQDIDKMLHLAVTKDDVDMLFRAIQKIPNNKEKIKYLETFMDMLFYLKIKDDIVIEMLNDQEFVKNMKSYRVFRMIVNILFYNRRYEDVVRAFEIFSNEFREPLPGFNLLCKSLYMINTNEAIEKMIPLVKMYISTNQNRMAIAHLVMLCINQDQPMVADELLNMFYRNKKDISLVQNLRIIVNSKLDRAEKAMEIAENLLNNDKAMTYDLKKFFPITVKFLREVVRRSNIEDQIKRFDSFEQRLNELAELDPSDLPWILRNFSLIYLSAKKDTLNQNDNEETNKTEPITNSSPIEIRENPKQIKSELRVENNSKITAANELKDPNFVQLGRLFKEGNDNEVVELFMKLIADRKSPLPDFYLSLATTSLMKLNSKASFKKFKDLLELYSIRGFKVCDESKLHMFLLAINQNDPVYALGFVSICDIDKSNMSLFKNLKAIVHAVSNNLKGAFNEIDEIVKLPLNKFTNEGTIFPYTLKIVGEIAKKTKSNSKQLQDLEAKLEIENRLSNIDLIQLSTRQVNENRYSRIPTSDKKVETVEKSSFISSRLEKLSLEGKDKKLLNEFIRFMNSEVNDETIGKLDKKLLNLVARAVKKSNSDIESIKKLVELLKNNPKLKFGPNFFIDMSISIINQKNPLYALEFIAEFDRDEVLKKERPTIYNNILAIGFSLIGRPEIALDQIDSIVKTRDLKPNDIYHGKVFKQAIDCLRSSVEKQQNSELTERFTKLEKSVYDNQRLCDENLERITDA